MGLRVTGRKKLRWHLDKDRVQWRRLVIAMFILWNLESGTGTQYYLIEVLVTY